MDNIIEKILKGFLGDKNKKDVKELHKYADKVLEAEKQIEKLSHDELRAKSDEFRAKLKKATSSQKQEIEELKQKIESIKDFEEKEILYDQIDTLNKDAYE